MSDFIFNLSSKLNTKATKIDVIGNGEPLVIVSGGPGFTYQYLKKPLSFLQAGHSLIFQNQPGCGGIPIKSGECTLECSGKDLADLLDLLGDIDNNISVVAHSWGSIVFLEALKHTKTFEHISKTILINPMPWTKESYEVARNNFIETIPEPVLNKFTVKMSTGGPAHEVMDLILPYYSPNPLPITGRDFEMNLDTYSQVNNSLGDFDFSKEVNALKSIMVILGGQDFVHRQQISQLLPSFHKMDIIEEAGHFPFYETENQFQAIMLNYLKNG